MSKKQEIDLGSAGKAAMPDKNHVFLVGIEKRSDGYWVIGGNADPQHLTHGLRDMGPYENPAVALIAAEMGYRAVRERVFPEFEQQLMNRLEEMQEHARGAVQENLN